MATALSRNTEAVPGRPELPDQIETFLHELAELSHKHGIGIAGEPTLFMLERDDFALAYGCDKESKLTLA